VHRVFVGKPEARVVNQSIQIKKPEGKRPWVDPGVDRMITLRLMYRKWDLGYGLDLAGSG
jgi:hypothetical protein